MANYNSFDDWKFYMQTVVKENGVGAITGPLLQTVLGELSDTAEWLVSVSGSSADARALAAEGWAVGTQRGVPVTEGSPYYQNNSLYWAEVVNGIAGSLSDVVREARAAAGTAESAAAGANAAAEGATSAATLATEKAGLADDAATLANQKAELADTKAGYATEQGDYAKEQGDYAKGEIDGAKGDYDSLADRFQHVDETAMYFEETGLSADPDLIDEYDRVLRVAYQMLTDMQSATEDTEAKAALAAAAAELCNARSVECAEKTALANTAAAYATAQGNYAKQKADEIDVARGEYQTLSDRLDAMQRQLEAALYFQAVNN